MFLASPLRRPLAVALGALCCAMFSLPAMAQAQPAPGKAGESQTVTMWSHWPDEASKRGYVEERVKRFQAVTPQCKVNLQFIQKSDLYASVKTSVRTGQAPDIFWLEPDEITFAKSGYLEPLNGHININNLEDWARNEWTIDGKVYGLPVEAYTVELYYNKDLMKKIGVELPAGMQMKQGQFTDMVKKAAGAGITPFANGVGDRPYPGAYFLQEVLLRKLGTDDYKLLLTGKLSFTDPRVIEAMTWVKQLVDAGAYPKSFATMKLGESHYYFHTNPGALTFPIASWYTGRAFVAPEKGGQPKGFPLGIMKYPTLDNSKCPECKTLAVGGSYVMYSRSKNKECAGKLMNSIATVDNGTRWLEEVLLQTGIKSDASRMQGIYVQYFKDLQERNKGAKFFVGTPLHHLTGKCADTFAQVLNRAFPGGQMSVQDAASQMDAACKASS